MRLYFGPKKLQKADVAVKPGENYRTALRKADVLSLRTGQKLAPEEIIDPFKPKKATGKYPIKSELEAARKNGHELHPAREWINPDDHNNLKLKFEGNPTARYIADAESGSDEPYQLGDTHNVQWGVGRPMVWNRPMPIPGKVDNLFGVLGKGVPLGNGADPFMWMDHKLGVTKRLLQEHADQPLQIHTRSDLIGHDDYLKHLKKHHVVYMHVPSMDEEVTRQIEPGAPSVSRRLTAAKKLKDHGIRVHIVHDKFTNDDIHPVLKQANAEVRVPGFRKIESNIKLPPEAVERVHQAMGLNPVKQNA
jgi:hypothetical protein